MAISDTTPPTSLPAVATDLLAKPTWIICGSEVRKSGVVIKENYGPSLDRLEVSHGGLATECGVHRVICKM